MNYKSWPEFDEHDSVIGLFEPENKLRAFIAIHRAFKGKPSFGATRMAVYSSEEQALKDALRLSRLMSYKSAMAGLGYGGAKAVIALPKQPLTSAAMQKLLKSYCQRVNRLKGRFITGADVGIGTKELAIMKKNSPYIMGQNQPVVFTVLGLVYALQETLQQVFQSSSLKSRTFAVQGLGKIGQGLIAKLYGQCGQIFAADIDEKRIAESKAAFPDLVIVPAGEIHKQTVDVFSPCARANALNAKTIPQLKCKIILGGANNQLASADCGTKLHQRGIVYAPDYVVNGGGLISVADEYENKNFDFERIEKRVRHIQTVMKKILEESAQRKLPTSIIADLMAEKIFNHKAHVPVPVN